MRVIDYPGTKQFKTVFEDICAHTSNVFSSDDVVTRVHESIHQINSELRNKHDCPAFYILQNKALLVDEPACKLSDVAKEIPQNQRGPNYQLYLVQAQQYWQNQPTYVLDEWSAYRAGAICAKETGVRVEDAQNHKNEFDKYAEALVRLAPELKVFLDYFKPNQDLPDYGTTYL